MKGARTRKEKPTTRHCSNCFYFKRYRGKRFCNHPLAPVTGDGFDGNRYELRPDEDLASCGCEEWKVKERTNDKA